jgi:para-aminobenzoate synthetase/4-amino-4-deoxychorismate lyase
MASFALLDDRDATAQRPSSRLYTGFVCEHRCMDPARLDGTCASIDAALQRAEALVVCNALRGALPAALKRQAADIHQ